MSIFKPIDKSNASVTETKLYKKQTLHSGSNGINSIQYRSGSLLAGANNRSDISGSYWESLRVLYYLSGSLEGTGSDALRYNQPPSSLANWSSPNPQRVNKFFTSGSVVSISQKYFGERIKPQSFKIAAIIPIRGKTRMINSKSLLEITINSARESKYINEIIVSSDEDETIKLAKSLGAIVPFKRPKKLSEDYIGIFEVLRFSLEQLELKKKNYDIIVCLEETYPFRSPSIIDKMIERLIVEGLDTIIAGRVEKRNIWVEKSGVTTLLSEGFMSRNLKSSKRIISLFGLCSATYPKIIRSGDLLSGKLGIYEINDPTCSTEVRDESSLNLANQIFNVWLKNQSNVKKNETK